MRRRALFRWLVAGGLLAVLSAPGRLAAAQGTLQLRISSVDPTHFPEITIRFSVTDGSGRRVPGLPTESFGVVEDRALLSPLQVAEESLGVRQVYVLDASSSLGIRDSLGRSRYDLARQALLDAWRQPPADQFGVDDWSLISTDRALVSHSASAAQLGASLFGHSPSFPSGVDSLDVVLRGLDHLADAAARPGMPEALIFITSAIPEEANLSVSNALARARAEGAALHVVWVSLPGADPTDPGLLLSLAQETGGTFRVLEPELGLTSLLERISAERTQYSLTYLSQVQATGTHDVSVQVAAEGREAESPPRTYAVEVQPPTVAFVSPPRAITRQTSDPATAWEAIPPTRTSLEVLIAFPDGHPRPLISSQLLVNGEVVDRRSAPPFNRFEWDLSTYRETGVHTLQVVANDSLNLQAASLPLTIQVQVVPPPRGLTSLGPALVPLLAAVGLLVAGSLVAARILAAGTAVSLIPEAVRPRGRKAVLRRAGLRREATHPTEAWLDPVDGEPFEAFALTGVDIAVGRDPSLTALPLLDESVSGLHAHITRVAGGAYWIRDQGSVAGTWVNYEPVPAAGRSLEHGDLIHVGRVGLRFRLATAPPPRLVRITRLDPNGDAHRSSPKDP